MLSEHESRRLSNLLSLQAAISLKREALEKRRREIAELADHLEEIRQQSMKFSGFIAAAWRQLEPTAEYKPSWHHDAIGEHIEAVHRGQIQRLQINQPPGTM